eukprot:TRINITY_DN8825_c0_g1_i1.p1 TRINITY_DN8825_c0_g1~~TRINITY_DN8825_c0_g1_i1.p1  ORF type:complete len:306 (-),score=-23.25 TRINITY_DN8825_c0_g1_i1:437-1354(-)
MGLSDEKHVSRSPGWLGDLLSGTYFSPCRQHAAAHKSERNFFCIRCRGDPLCSLCVQKHHSGPEHELLQVRRSSYHDVVRVSELSRMLDLHGIQIYVINSAKIVFLNARPQSRPVKGAPFSCETCQRTLLDANRFCSIACKLSALRFDPTITLRARVASSAEGARAAAAGPFGAAGQRVESPVGRGAGETYSGDAYSDDDSGASSMQRRHGFHRKRELPPLVLDGNEGSWASDGGQGDEGEGAESSPLPRKKRPRVAHTEFLPPLSPVVAPGTPPQGLRYGAVDGKPAGWRVHRRKSTPHRSPLN